MFGPMMGDLRVVLRTGPSGVASFGRVTHAPADSTLYRTDTARSNLHQSGAAPGFDGVGSIRQIFFKGWGGRVPLGCGRPCDHQRQAPAVHCVRERGGAPDPVHRDSAGHSCCDAETFTHSANCPEDRRVPTGAVLGQGGRRPLLYNDRCLGLTELKTVEVPQLQYSDKVVDVPVCAVHRRLWTSL